MAELIWTEPARRHGKEPQQSADSATQVKKWIGAYAAALDGLDTLVFAGGIGENSPLVGARICEGLGFLGIELDETRNAATEAVISADAGRVTVRVIPTDEELMIARSVCHILKTCDDH